MGVATGYTDGLGRHVVVGPDTLVHVCATLGAPIEAPGGAAGALQEMDRGRADATVPPVIVAWDGHLPEGVVSTASAHGLLTLEDGSSLVVDASLASWGLDGPLPPGYHRLETGAGPVVTTVIAAPTLSWRRSGEGPGWGVAAHLAALRTGRSRSVGDLADLGTLCRWVGDHGGDLVSVLPLLPTFNDLPTQPSPYSPVSRLFWSELVLDLGTAHEAAVVTGDLRVDHADAEVRAALADRPPPAGVDPELAAYARFRGAQLRLGRDWRRWPDSQRRGHLGPDDVDAAEERFHLVAQVEAASQLDRFRRQLDRSGVRLGLDLAVGVHPCGYDPWSRPGLFAADVSVGAPPDAGFPSGQDWGFPPVLPEASRAEGHAYLAAATAHQARMAGVLRVDHVMALSRLFWIPDGAGVADGTYVSYPRDELFAVLSLESHRHPCELVGEDLGTVPPGIDEALSRHGIRGMYVGQFEAASGTVPVPPAPDRVAMVGPHDTPTFAGWLDGGDIPERVHLGLLAPDAEAGERAGREAATLALASAVHGDLDAPDELVALVLEWLGASDSPLVITWLEDLWLEVLPVNIPGSGSDEWPNWQRPMSLLLDRVVQDPGVNRILERLDAARRAASAG